MTFKGEGNLTPPVPRDAKSPSLSGPAPGFWAACTRFLGE